MHNVILDDGEYAYLCWEHALKRNSGEELELEPNHPTEFEKGRIWHCVSIFIFVLGGCFIWLRGIDAPESPIVGAITFFGGLFVLGIGGSIINNAKRRKKRISDELREQGRE